MISKKLFDILPKDFIVNASGDENLSIKNLAFDSREVKKGGLFFAIQGEKIDGNNYIAKAIENGAFAVVSEKERPDNLEVACYVQVKSVRSVLAKIANAFYDYPSRQLKLVGVTGTNGKTTVCTLLYDLHQALDIKCGLISTVKYSYPGVEVPATHTTPDPIVLNSMLHEMVNQGVECVFMEVSSHAIEQKRIDGLEFEIGVFTNLTHDHLDYHLTFKNYLEVKKRFFDGLRKNALAIYNEDDKNGEVMVQNSEARKMAYSLFKLSDIKGKIISNAIEGLQLNINGKEVFCRLVGKFNAYNILAAYAVASELGVEEQEILLAISRLRGAEGRFELLVDRKKKIFGIVDYAHTPDALENVLDTLNELVSSPNKIITVVGCGGDRDRSKRPKMGMIAAVKSDHVILTSDNPRMEDPEKIIDEIEEGVKGKNNYVRISDRRQAIRTAVMLAKENDVVLVAGKGHENYQEINGVKHPFSDKEELETLFSNNKK